MQHLLHNTAMPRVDSTLMLIDGRTVGYAEFGPAEGPPIVHCHGNGTSRLELDVVESLAASAGVRLISIDRPGVGRSDPKPGYRLLDWPDELVQVADQLGIARFAIEGMSGGAPFALACAYKIPERLQACGLISPATGPFLNQVASPAMKAALWTLLHFPPLDFREPRSGNLESLDRLAQAASDSARARFDESSVGGELRR